jgi:polar amino acid transport system substrate-binding protein
LRRSLVIITLSLAAVFSASAQEGVLRVGLESGNPPWSYNPERLVPFDKDPGPVLASAPPPTAAQLRALTGIDVEVAQALARRMGKTVQFVQAGWYDLESLLLAKKFDVILSAWTPSRKTPPTILASEPYYSWGLQLAVRADDSSIRSYADLAGLPVGHIKDPAIEQTLSSMSSADLKGYQAETQLFHDLRKGVLRAVVADSPYVRWRVANDKGFRLVGEPLNRLGYHVGVRVEDEELFAMVQSAVKAFVGSPEAAAIRRKWESPQAR